MMAMFVVLVLSVYLGYQLDSPLPVQASAKPAAARLVDTAVPEQPIEDSLKSVAADMDAVIAAQTGLSAAATLIDLDTGKQYDTAGVSTYYEAASTSKLVAIFDYIHEVELGHTTLDKSIQGQTAQDIIMRMIIYSDNDAWDKLNGYLKFKSEQSYLDSLGVAGKMVPENIQFRTGDMAKLLRLFYEGKLMNAQHQAMIFDYMSRTTTKNLIQAAVPAGAAVYHKYGQIDGVLHDASIIQYQGRNFVLVIYTNNAAGTSGQYNAQVDLIHAITAAVFTDVVKL